jgi:hypothetical protein
VETPLQHPLRELLPTRQVPGDSPRRWFASPGADLIVWLRGDGSMEGFQFCYDKEDVEHALTWMDGCGYSHMRVASGRAFAEGGFYGAPFLVPDGVLDPGRILGLFRAEAILLPGEYAAVVIARLEELTEKLKLS